MENTFKEIMEKVESGVMSNASRLKIPKDGIGIELMVDGNRLLWLLIKVYLQHLLYQKLAHL